MRSIVVLACIFLIISAVQQIFKYLLTICASSLEKYLFRLFAHFKIQLFVLSCELYELFIYFE